MSQTQWYVNNGKCGVCGDPWSQPSPRDNEAGGRYGKGIITRTYTPGQVIQTLQAPEQLDGSYKHNKCIANLDRLYKHTKCTVHPQR